MEAKILQDWVHGGLSGFEIAEKYQEDVDYVYDVIENYCDRMKELT